MGPLANSEGPDKMQHDAAFHQSLHCLLRIKQPLGTEIHHELEKSTCGPFKYAFIIVYFLHKYVWDNPSELQRDKETRIIYSRSCLEWPLKEKTKNWFSRRIIA